MNREQRRQAERKGRKELAARAGLSEFEVKVISGAISTLGQAADNLEAGLLDPGTQGRADFISQVRELQAQLESDPASTLAHLGAAFSAPVLARMELALATAAPVRPDKEGA